ncbi:hypothetical protein ACOTDN_29015 [Achromobacter xylosoxidans]|uniref:hypothetical protein n=1 Tax=Alcaligenes xylosoxydans xylosoxydans TaxID=85698 RepID=UPI0003321F60|nr:hypothetical protein [Achromobacter xylosoxidans]MCH4591539.1 hypothetical protein [Achromobacter xylosoxidans]CCH05443.1 putative secreted protein [Achromobacter xylosoxidans NH44784-1996]CUJ53901.1 Uncharacterised protein [Achromobacter xylosoxidans]
MSTVTGAGASGIAGMDLGTMDLETALMAVQSQRAQLLETSLRQQLDSVNARNTQMASLNESITAKGAQNNKLEASNVSMQQQIAELKDLQGRLAASKCPNPEGWYGLSWGQGDDKALSHATLDQIKQAGLTVPGGADAPRDVDRNGTMDAKGRVVQGWVDQISAKVAGLEASIKENTASIETNKNDITAAKNQVDSLGNTQQMEMLRLQGLTNKRNEAFDVMTNFLKKMRDSRSSIIGNMR